MNRRQHYERDVPCRQDDQVRIGIRRAYRTDHWPAHKVRQYSRILHRRLKYMLGATPAWRTSSDMLVPGCMPCSTKRML